MKGYINNLECLGHLVSLRLSVSLILIGLRKEFDSFVQNYNMHSMGKTVNELHAMLKLHEKTMPKNNAPALHAIRAGKVQKGHWKRNCPQYLAVLLKRKTQLQELLVQPGDLSLYMGNGQRKAVEAIGVFYLCLPSGLEIVLNNCHYAPSITRGVISVSCLYKDGFVNCFVNNTIQVSRNNMVYFSAIPRDGIFEIDLSNSYANYSSIYTVSNKRTKLDLDSALLWHCCLGHISKKRIEKLQHDGLLNSTDLRAFEKCVPCMSGRMQRKPYTHQVERAKDLLGLIHTDSFWDYALETAARILNMVPTKKVEKTPYEVWHRQAPKLSYLKVWGCKALVKQDTLTKPNKLEPRSIKCIFIGYPKETMGYSFYYPPENKVLVARNAKFLENSLITQEASRSLEDLEIIEEEDTHPSIDTSLHHEEDDLKIDEPQSDINPIRRSTKARRPTYRLYLYIDAEEHELGDLGEPANYKAALLDPESDKWLSAMNVEMQSMKNNEVWELVYLPTNGKAVDSKWLFKKKTDMDGAVHTYKACLVAKGYTQTSRIDYEETFSLVADIKAIKILIAITAFYDYEIWQMDVKTAFLNGYLSEEVYMEQHEGEAAYILGIKIYRDRSQQLIGASTPIELKRMQNVPYAMVVGFIMYVVRCTRPDVAFAQNITSQFLQNPDADDLKSQTGYVFVLDRGAVDWNCAKQSIFATSYAEAEYIVTFDASKEASGITKGARHFRAKVHYLREVIEFGDIKLEKVHTYDNLADPFTKALAFPKHSELTRNIRMLPASSLM
ncbi:retrotransposon protein, putative, ty1-copia subclass [Tanacetum coccineum]